MITPSACPARLAVLILILLRLQATPLDAMYGFNYGPSDQRQDGTPPQGQGQGQAQDAQQQSQSLSQPHSQNQSLSPHNAHSSPHSDSTPDGQAQGHQSQVQPQLHLQHVTGVTTPAGSTPSSTATHGMHTHQTSSPVPPTNPLLPSASAPAATTTSAATHQSITGMYPFPPPPSLWSAPASSHPTSQSDLGWPGTDRNSLFYPRRWDKRDYERYETHTPEVPQPHHHPSNNAPPAFGLSLPPPPLRNGFTDREDYNNASAFRDKPTSSSTSDLLPPSVDGYIHPRHRPLPPRLQVFGHTSSSPYGPAGPIPSQSPGWGMFGVPPQSLPEVGGLLPLGSNGYRDQPPQPQQYFRDDWTPNPSASSSLTASAEPSSGPDRVVAPTPSASTRGGRRGGSAPPVVSVPVRGRSLTVSRGAFRVLIVLKHLQGGMI